MLIRATLAACCLLTALSGQADGIPWLSDLTQAKQLATEKSAPILAVFRCET